MGNSVCACMHMAEYEYCFPTQCAHTGWGGADVRHLLSYRIQTDFQRHYPVKIAIMDYVPDACDTGITCSVLIKKERDKRCLSLS